MKTVTDRDIFKKISKALIKQDEQSVDEDGDCVYRGESFDNDHKTKCAVGHIINTKNYKPSLENRSIASPKVKNAIRLSNPNWKIGQHGWLMLNNLQLVHDENDVSGWSNNFEEMESQFTKSGNYKLK